MKPCPVRLDCQSVEGLPAYFLGKQGVSDTMFFPETRKVELCPRIEDFKQIIRLVGLSIRNHCVDVSTHR